MFHSSIIHNGSLYIFGGRAHDMEPLDDLYQFDISKGIWKKVTAKGKYPSGRWAHTMTLIDNTKFLVFGGCNSTEYFNDLYEFSFGKYLINILIYIIYLYLLF